MNHVISISSGLSSAVMAERVLSKYPDAYVVFMDTLIEDEDNYRFLDEWLEGFEPRNYIHLGDGRNPLEVFEDRQIIPNQKIAPCTFELKIKLFRDWLESLAGESTVYIGFDYEEMHRCDATTAAYNEAGYEVDYPLLWKPLMSTNYARHSRREWGIEPPRMYAMGYGHANCGGCCVKQGQADWLRTLSHFPERFSRYEAWEEEARKRHGDYAFLRDQSGGSVKPLPLSELRKRWEEGDITPRVAKSLQFVSPCITCGVGQMAIWDIEQ